MFKTPIFIRRLLSFHSYHKNRMWYLLKAAFSLHSSCQLLLLLHSHLGNLLQDFFPSLFGVHASVQHLSQGVHFWGNGPRQPGGSLLRSSNTLRGQSLSHAGAGWWRRSQGGSWHWTWGRESFDIIKTAIARILSCWFSKNVAIVTKHLALLEETYLLINSIRHVPNLFSSIDFKLDDI